MLTPEEFAYSAAMQGCKARRNLEACDAERLARLAKAAAESNLGRAAAGPIPPTPGVSSRAQRVLELYRRIPEVTGKGNRFLDYDETWREYEAEMDAIERDRQIGEMQYQLDMQRIEIDSLRNEMNQ
jgi:hypothetical protein